MAAFLSGGEGWGVHSGLARKGGLFEVFFISGSHGCIFLLRRPVSMRTPVMWHDWGRGSLAPLRKVLWLSPLDQRHVRARGLNSCKEARRSGETKSAGSAGLSREWEVVTFLQSACPVPSGPLVLTWLPGRLVFPPSPHAVSGGPARSGLSVFPSTRIPRSGLCLKSAGHSGSGIKRLGEETLQKKGCG